MTEITSAVYKTDYKALFLAHVSGERMRAQDFYFLEHEEKFIESIDKAPGSYLILKSKQTAAGDDREQAIYKECFEYIKSKNTES